MAPFSAIASFHLLPSAFNPETAGMTSDSMGALDDSHFDGNVRCTAFLECSGANAVHPVTHPPPPCVDDGQDCGTREDFLKLQQFAQDVDKSQTNELQAAKRARLLFERRVNDFRYAEIQNKSELLANTYGPFGPQEEGGSYLYELRRWGDTVHRLYRDCASEPQCNTLLNYLKDHPEDDMTTGGGHGKSKSSIYNELRLSCLVGRTRAPVPNDSPVWCDTITGLCERKSARRWWREAHPEFAKPLPWVDDRTDYDYLKGTCEYIHDTRMSPRDINKFQKDLEAQVNELKTEYCSPKWVDGYCSTNDQPKRHAHCELPDGKHCRFGLVIPGAENNNTAHWKEQFQEKVVQVEIMPFVIATPSPQPVKRRRDRLWSKRKLYKLFF